MKRAKRIICILLTAILLIGIVPAVASDILAPDYVDAGTVGEPEVQTVTVTFVVDQANGRGTLVGETTVEVLIGDSLTAEQIPTPIPGTSACNSWGVTFDFWRSPQIDGWHYNLTTLVINEATTFFAIFGTWTGSCFITLLWNDGRVGVDNIFGRVWTDHGKVFDVPPPPSREGFRFVGWTTDAAGDNDFDLSPGIISGCRYLYAQWMPLPPLPPGGGGVVMPQPPIDCDCVNCAEQFHDWHHRSSYSDAPEEHWNGNALVIDTHAELLNNPAFPGEIAQGYTDMFFMSHYLVIIHVWLPIYTINSISENGEINITRRIPGCGGDVAFWHIIIELCRNFRPAQFSTVITDHSESIEVSSYPSHTFPSAAFGYGPQTPHVVTVTNTGSTPVGWLSVGVFEEWIDGVRQNNFTIDTRSIPGIPVGGTATFTVTPNVGLAVGTYEAIVFVGNDFGEAHFTVSFTVTEREQEQIPQPPQEDDDVGGGQTTQPPPGGGNAGGGIGGGIGGGGQTTPPSQQQPNADSDASEDSSDLSITELPRVEVTPTLPSEEDTNNIADAVADFAQDAADRWGAQIKQPGSAIVVELPEDAPSTVVTLTNLPEDVDVSSITTMAMLNVNGTLTPIPTRVVNGRVSVLLTEDAVLVPLNVSATFTDLGRLNANVRAEIERAASLAIVEGFLGGTFRPGDEVTAQQTVAMFLRATGIPVEWESAIATGVEAGFITSVAVADAPMTRIQTAQLIVNALEHFGLLFALTDEDVAEILARFPDADALTTEQRLALAISVNLDIFRGHVDTTIRPNEVLNRSQMASLAVRLQSVLLGA